MQEICQCKKFAIDMRKFADKIHYMLKICRFMPIICKKYALNMHCNYMHCISTICKNYAVKMICRNMQLCMQNMQKSIYCIYQCCIYPTLQFADVGTLGHRQLNQTLIFGPSEHALQSLSAVTVGGPSRREVTPTASMPWRSRPAPPRHYQHRRGRAAPDAAGAPRLRGNSRRPQELARWRERCCGAAAWWVLWRRGWRGRALRMQLTKPH